jgi:hypothetical protein
MVKSTPGVLSKGREMPAVQYKLLIPLDLISVLLNVSCAVFLNGPPSGSHWIQLNEQLVSGDFSSRQAGGDGDGGLLSEEGEKSSARDLKGDQSEGGRRKDRIVDFIL